MSAFLITAGVVIGVMLLALAFFELDAYLWRLRADRRRRRRGGYLL